MSRLRRILDLADKHELAVYQVVGLLKDRKRGLLIKLIVLAAILVLVFNPTVIAGILIPFTDLTLPAWYRQGFWIALALLAIAILIVAWRMTPPAAERTDFSERSAIKGLRPFEVDDAGLFRQLQRESALRESLLALSARDFRFGILCGASGCGKTSFLRAGLLPALQEPPYNHRCVYVKFTDLDPVEAIRHALAGQLPEIQTDAARSDLLTLLNTAATAAPEPLVLLFDQFEQFFVHQRYKKDRAPFIEALAAWYGQASTSAVKILVAVREDFAGRLIELQKAMRYMLGPQESMRLEGFTPREATAVFEVIAERENLKCDRTFVETIAEEELANAEDGLVSPVDVQILAWMIAGQRGSDERAFDRTAYRKLGGVEGLLERYLARALDARATDTRRQAALKIMLALTDLDRNTRAGVLAEEDLRKKLAGQLSARELTEAVAWLARSDVRLITPSRRNGAQGYELAHERLIPALRRLAGKELSEAEQASLLLDRRVNEWLGNDRVSRYLLTGRERRLVESQRPYLTWTPQREAKEALLTKSKRRWQVRIGGVAAVVVLGLGALGWMQSPWGQVWQVKRDMIGLAYDVNDGEAFAMATHALARLRQYEQAQQMALGSAQAFQQRLTNMPQIDFGEGGIIDEQDRARLDGVVEREMNNLTAQLENEAQDVFLRDIAAIAAEAGDLAQARTFANALTDSTARQATLQTIIRTMVGAGDLTQAHVFTDDVVDPQARAEILHDIARAAMQTGNQTQARDVLKQASTAAMYLVDPLSRARFLRRIIGTTMQAGDAAQASVVLAQALTAAEAVPDAYAKAEILGAMAEAAAQANDPDQAQQLLTQVWETADTLTSVYGKESVLRIIARATVWVDGVTQAQAVAEAVENPVGKLQTLCSVAKAATETGDSVQARAVLAYARAFVADFTDSSRRALALHIVAETAAQLGYLDEIRAILVQAQAIADVFFAPADLYDSLYDQILGINGGEPAAVATLERQEQVLAIVARAVAQADTVEARGVLADAQALVENLSEPTRQVSVLTRLVEIAARAGLPDLAQTLLAQARTAADSISGYYGTPVDVRFQIAEAALHTGDREQALAITSEMPVSLEKVQALALIAEAVTPGDSLRPQPLLEAARAITIGAEDNPYQRLNKFLDPSFSNATTVAAWRPTALRAVARAYARTGAWRQARGVADEADSKSDRVGALAAILEVWAERKHPARTY